MAPRSVDDKYDDEDEDEDEDENDDDDDCDDDDDDDDDDEGLEDDQDGVGRIVIMIHSWFLSNR